MATDILMPALSPTMTEGKLSRWLKKPGDSISPGDVIAEIETDKATMEIEAIDEGTLGEIKVQDGTEGVAVNAVIATLLGAGESAGAAKPAPKVEAPKAAAAPTPEAPKAAAPAPAPTPVPKAAEAPAPVKNGAISHDDSRVVASPLARRMAALAGIDLNTLKGSGPGGRVVKSDIEKAAPQTVPQSRAASGSSSGPIVSSIDARKQADLLGMPYEAVPNSSVRKVIARRLTEAKQTIPHFYLTVDCDIDALLDLRKRYNAIADTNSGKASINDFVIRTAALALRKIPDANVSWAEDSILHYQDVDISVAVATPNGLITPIIHKADTKSPRQIAGEMRDLAARARDGKLKPQEFQGGTFSISNLGMYGVSHFGAIINPPQACILAVGNGEPKAVVRDGQIVIKTIMSCTLSVDHRAVDGALGAEYLAAFKTLIEDPYSLLI